MESSSKAPKRTAEFFLDPSPQRKKQRITPTRRGRNTEEMYYQLIEAIVKIYRLALSRDNLVNEQDALDKRLREMDLNLRKLRW